MDYVSAKVREGWSVKLMSAACALDRGREQLLEEVSPRHASRTPGCLLEVMQQYTSRFSASQTHEAHVAIEPLAEGQHRP